MMRRSQGGGDAAEGEHGGRCGIAADAHADGIADADDGMARVIGGEGIGIDRRAQWQQARGVAADVEAGFGRAAGREVDGLGLA